MAGYFSDLAAGPRGGDGIMAAAKWRITDVQPQPNGDLVVTVEPLAKAQTVTLAAADVRQKGHLKPSALQKALKQALGKLKVS